MDKTSVWGPRAWYVFHKYAFVFRNPYYNATVNKAIAFYEVDFLKYIMCDSCTNHYRNLIRMYPVDTSTRMNLIKWTIFIHNQVNERVGHPRLSVESAYRFWEDVFYEEDNGQARYRL